MWPRKSIGGKRVRARDMTDLELALGLRFPVRGTWSSYRGCRSPHDARPSLCTNVTSAGDMNKSINISQTACDESIQDLSREIAPLQSSFGFKLRLYELSSMSVHHPGLVLLLDGMTSSSVNARPIEDSYKVRRISEMWLANLRAPKLTRDVTWGTLADVRVKPIP
ncbi:hypothetical protein CROQUDRAFT_86877 [Cronartium quercuum f. sp. fusiforme G11]|uniref:Uncharacterized protein n=1 Tax=Cronartium quercuum f. sp. fusiforme G11 TaxID=708437 RepID=A0A9P6NT19_9BASI|nr:hypothetical protein CROQUDRAFT_86877 [Cronartium quercuum f. sp. fusiforme G11]